MNDKLNRYLETLLEVNSHTNLTAIREPKEIAVRHFEDSKMLLGAADFSNKTVIDIGSGAGFPGLVLKIYEPSIKLTLLDSTEKKVKFLQRVCGELELTNVTCLHGRAEELAHDPQHREQFDVATARGVAAIPALCEISLPFVKIGGVLLAMKEKPEGFPEAKLFGGEEEAPYLYKLSNGKNHAVCIYKKTSPTLGEYPRKWGRLKSVNIAVAAGSSK